MTNIEIQFWDDEGAYPESFWNWTDRKTSELKDDNKIDYLGHIKAWIEVLSKKEDITEEISIRAMEIITEYDLENVEIDNDWIKHFKSETNKKILSMIEVVLINYQHSAKK